VKPPDDLQKTCEIVKPVNECRLREQRRAACRFCPGCVTSALKAVREFVVRHGARFVLLQSRSVGPLLTLVVTERKQREAEGNSYGASPRGARVVVVRVAITC
jgi:hypothetical protein